MRTGIQRIVKEEIQKKIILEKKVSDLKKSIKILDLVIEENKRSDALNEDAGSLISGFFGLLPTGGQDYVIEQIAQLVIQAFSNATGIQITPDSGFGKMLKNFVPEFIAKGHIDLFNRFVLQGDKSACRDFVAAVMDTLIETGKETIVDEELIPSILQSITTELFGQPMELGKIASIGSGISRETVNAMLKDFLTPLVDPITEFVCGEHDIEKLRDEMSRALSNMTGGSSSNVSSISSLPATGETAATRELSPADVVSTITKRRRG